MTDHIRKLMRDPHFTNFINDMEKRALNTFLVFRNFLGNKKTENYKYLIQTLQCEFSSSGLQHDHKVHFLNNHLDKFNENLDDVSNEQGVKSRYKSYGGAIPRKVGYLHDGRLLLDY